jgi:uncharacterized protein (DUF58 family)
MLFDETTLRKLTRLSLVATRVREGILKGDRRSTRRGTSIEFADYRNYTPGDDLRRLDWNAYARLDRPFLKLFEEEEDLAVHLLVDGSGSMDWGEAGLNKFQYALRLAGALGAIALATGDRLNLAILRTDTQTRMHGPIQGGQNTLRLLKFLEVQSAGGRTDLDRSLRDYLNTPKRPGLCFILSDFLSPSGYQAGLSQLLGRGFEVVLVHLFSPDELEPPLSGDLRLMDVETSQGREVSLDGRLRLLYHQRVQEWRDELHQFCRKRGARYLDLSTQQPWDQAVLYQMHLAGIVQ